MGAMINMIRILPTSALMLLIGVSSADAVGELFRCTPLEGVSFTDNGTLNRLNRLEGLYVLIDTASGMIRFGDHKTGAEAKVEWRVVQEGSDVNDFVAIPQPEYGEKEVALGMTVTEVVNSAARSAVTNWIRVRAWEDKPIVTFVWAGLDAITTGVCTQVQ
jgi:hypothetical protein